MFKSEIAQFKNSAEKITTHLEFAYGWELLEEATMLLGAHILLVSELKHNIQAFLTEVARVRKTPTALDKIIHRVVPPPEIPKPQLNSTVSLRKSGSDKSSEVRDTRTPVETNTISAAGPASSTLPAYRIPAPEPLVVGKEVSGDVVHLVSPLEFYIVPNFSRVEYIEQTILDQEAFPLKDVNIGDCCIVANQTVLGRARVIDVVGVMPKKEARVYLVDCGRSLFVSVREGLFALPELVASIPDQALYCTLNEADSRALDHAAMIEFHTIVGHKNVTVISDGSSRRTHGLLVDLIAIDGVPYEEVRKAYQHMKRLMQSRGQPLTMAGPLAVDKLVVNEEKFRLKTIPIK